MNVVHFQIESKCSTRNSQELALIFTNLVGNYFRDVMFGSWSSCQRFVSYSLIVFCPNHKQALAYKKQTGHIHPLGTQNARLFPLKFLTALSPLVDCFLASLAAIVLCFVAILAYFLLDSTFTGKILSRQKCFNFHTSTLLGANNYQKCLTPPPPPPPRKSLQKRLTVKSNWPHWPH